MATKNAVGNSLTGSTGSGAFVGANSPTLIAPALGTPASGVLSNCTGFPAGRGALAANISSDQSVVANTATKITFNNETFDIDGWYDNATNYRYTPLIAGKYLIIAQVFFAGTLTANTALTIQIRKNGATITTNAGRAAGTNSQTLQLVDYVDMNGSTDYIEIWGNLGAATTPVFSSASSATFVRAMLVGI